MARCVQCDKVLTREDLELDPEGLFCEVHSLDSRTNDELLLDD